MSKRTKTTLGLLIFGTFIITGCGAKNASAPSGHSSPSKSQASSPSSVNASPSRHSTSSPSMGNFPPKLSGQTIRIANAGPGPGVSDTNFYLTAQILKSWGATIKYSNDPAQTGEESVLAGQNDISIAPLPALVKAGLMIFGPGDPHVSGVVVGGANVSQLSQLPGKRVAISTLNTPDAVELKAILKGQHIAFSSLHLVTGMTAAVTVPALLSGEIDAAVLNYGPYLKLANNPKYHALAFVSKALPKLADSFMGARPSWVSKNPQLAAAVDEAWLQAAEIFQKHPHQWATDANQYTKGAVSGSEIQQLYGVMHQGGLFPDVASAYSKQDLTYNEQAAISTGSLTKTVPLNQWATLGPWQMAIHAVFGTKG